MNIHDDTQLVIRHSEQLARLEFVPEKLDKMDEKLDVLTNNFTKLNAERNIIAGIIGLAAGYVSSFFNRGG